MLHALDRPNGTHRAHAWHPDLEGPGVLALHGFTGSGADWAPVAERLQVPLLAPDLVGHGQTVAPLQVDAYRMRSVVDDCLAWCEERPSWVVVGYSMGGRVALRLAQQLGERLEGLVLISASPGIEDPGERDARALRDRDLAAAIEREGTAWFAERWASHPLIRSQQQIPWTLLEPMTARRLQNRPHGLAGSLRGMGQGVVEPVWGVLRGLRVPTLCITGDEDARYTTMAERCVRLLPEARHLRVPEAGHCTHLEALEPVTRALCAFLAARGVSSARGTC